MTGLNSPTLWSHVRSPLRYLIYGATFYYTCFSPNMEAKQLIQRRQCQSYRLWGNRKYQAESVELLQHTCCSSVTGFIRDPRSWNPVGLLHHQPINYIQRPVLLPAYLLALPMPQNSFTAIYDFWYPSFAEPLLENSKPLCLTTLLILLGLNWQHSQYSDPPN